MGRVLSEEHKAKIGAANKGRKRPDLAARNRSEENREKVRVANIGRAHSDETKARLSAIAKADPNRRKVWAGRRHSEESKQKMRSAHAGTVVSEETRQKLSAAQKGNKHALGFRHTEETKRRLREINRGKRRRLDELLSLRRQCDGHPYYVYILLREDGRTPFYVGMGKGDRWNYHERYPGKGSTHKARIIRSMKERGIPVPKMKVADGLSADVAASVERSLIEAYGREPTGILTNSTKGGHGLLDASTEVRQRISRKVSALLKGNQRRAGKPHSPEVRAKISASLLARRRAKATD